MEKISTFVLAGIPEQLAVTFTLIALALTLAPWIEGIEIGPLKIPKLPIQHLRFLRIVGPITFIILLAGFAKTWAVTATKPDVLSEPSSFAEYQERYFSNDRKERKPLKKLVVQDEIATRFFMSIFGKSEWNGGTHWGKIVFDSSGRSATYTNGAGRSPGKILLQGAALGMVPMILGEWWQEDGQTGLLLALTGNTNHPNILLVQWGPEYLVEDSWDRMSKPVVETDVIR